MKMKQLFKTFTLAVLGVAAMMSQQVHGQTATISFSPNAPNGGPNDADDQPNGTVFSSIAGSVPISFGEGNAGDADFGPLELTADGFTGFFNVSATLSSNNTTAGSPIQRGGVGAVGVFGNGQNTLINGDESLTVSDFVLDFVSGDDVFQFDGFSGVFLGNNQGDTGRTAQVNGVLIANDLTGNGGTSFTLAPIDLADSIEISGVTGNGLSLNGVQASFSVAAVPEPSSALILGFAAFGCICKRRRS